MRAKFGSDPTAGSKMLSFKFISRWDRIKCSLFTVEGCSPKTNQAISPTVKYTETMGPGKSVHYKEVFSNQGCSLREVSLYAKQIKTFHTLSNQI